MPRTSSDPYFSAGLAAAISAAIFIADVKMPLGAVIGVCYFLPVFIASRISGLYPTTVTALGCSILAGLGMYYSPHGGEIQHVSVNRTLALLVIWSSAFFLTTRKQAEIVLKESVERFRSAFEESMIPMALVDNVGKLIRFNTAFANLLGYSDQELKKMNFKSLSHPDDLDVELPLYEQLIAGQIDSYVLEKRYFRKTGEIICVELYATVVRDTDGNPIQFIGQVQDITERKRTEDELRRFECITSNSNDLMALVDKNYIYRAVNNPYLRAFDKSRDEIIGLSALEIFGEELCETVIKPNAQKCFAGQSVQFQSWYDFPDHTRRSLDVAYSPYYGKDNCVEGFVVISRDITDRKEMEEALEKARNLNLQILDSAGEGIYGIDRNGCITFINPAGAKMIGWERDGAVGLFAHDVLHHTTEDGNPFPATQCPIYAAVEDGEVRHITNDVFWKKGGTSFPVDYVSTPIFESGEVTGAVVVFRDTTEAQRLSKELLYQATHDALTGLVNRTEFEHRLKLVFERIEVDQSKHAMCYIDLDQFKVVNDTCGHAAGDQMLRQISAVLQEGIRKQDTVARLGGDEFGVLMEHCSVEQAHRVVNSMREAVQDFQFKWENRTFRVGISIGLVEITNEIPDIRELLRRADAACYMAKDLGRDRVHVYRPEDTELAERHGEMQWVERIQQALEQDCFCLYAQPIVPLDSSGDTHFELLIRMEGDDGQLIPPGAFLPAAERYNLITQLDTWVIKKAFSLLRQNPAFLDQVSCISINLSGQSLSQLEFLDFIVSELKSSGIEGGKICFEITETAAIANLGTATKFMSTLNALYCRFALDDFGSGLSSFAYLKSLPVDYLKIDGSFVRDIVDDLIDRAMVKSINEIGHVMGMKTIAEFVENDEIKGMLQNIGVDYAQGYAIGKPEPFSTLLNHEVPVLLTSM